MFSCISITDSGSKSAANSNKVKPSRIIGKIGSYDVVKILGRGADGDVLKVVDSNFVSYAMKLSKIGKEGNLNHEVENYKHL